MKAEFSLLDFEDDFSDHRKKFFIFMAARVPHIRREIHYLPRRKKNSVYVTRCTVSIYNTEESIKAIEAKINKGRSGYTTRYVPQWKDHIKTIRRVTNEIHDT